MLNIGHTYTSVSMIDKGMVNFFRTLPIGGKKFTDAIVQSLGKEFKEAQEIKEQQLDLNKRKDPATKAVLPLLDNLLLEVRRSINYYFKKFNDGKAMSYFFSCQYGSIAC
jgi:type IV pilus assembly protein PilM